MKNRIERHLVVPDLHFPFHSPSYCKLIPKVIKHLSPTSLTQMGDFTDWPQLSVYDKDPGRREDIVDDIDEYRKTLLSWMKAAGPGVPFHQLLGNHEDRYRRFIWKHAKQLHRAVKDIDELLRVDTLPNTIHFHAYDTYDSHTIADVVIHHGVMFNKAIAVNNLDKYPFKFIQGHTHRVQRASNGRHWSASIGCGCNIRKSMHRPVPSDWQHAFAVVNVHKGEGHLQIVEVDDGTCVIDGKRLSV